jgi:CheY-like chemotaxis protein
MPLINPRIIVVDARQSLHHIVRAAMELMGRRPRLIETYTSDDALFELRLSSPDLLITAHTLGDTTNGPMLALLAKRELAALPVIVMANEDDPELDEETLSQSPFQYLHRPFAPEAFIRALRIALDGPEAAPKEAIPEAIVPVPPVDFERLRPVMFRLMRDVGAMAAVLADRNGKVVAYEGAAGYVDRDALSAALGPGFGDTMKILPLIGDQPRVLKYFDGERSNLFGLALGLHHFLMLIYDGKAPASALGNVKRFGGAAVNEMLEIVGPVAFELKPTLQAAPAPSPQPRAAEAHHTSKRRTKVRTQEIPVVTASEASADKDKSEGKKATGGAGNFDASLLDALDSLDLSKADEMFDPDKLAGSAGSPSDNTISFDDALMQGIIGDIDEP